MPNIPLILGTLEAKVMPEHTALVIVDMLNDFLHPAGKTATRANRPITYARAVISAMQSLLTAAREKGVFVAHVVHTTLPDHLSDSGPWLDARSRAVYSVIDVCMDGSWGQQVIDELCPQRGEALIRKYRYSGFVGTNLDLVLRSRRIRTVICCGVSTNVCVEATARDAFSHDYYVVIPGDSCASWDMELHRATLATAARRYATICQTEEIVQIWQGSRVAT